MLSVLVCQHPHGCHKQHSFAAFASSRTGMPWNPAKAKVQLRLSVQRLRSLQQKKEALAKSTRREIATILERGKIETARLKTESMINEDIYTELLELLELYCELLIARFGLLDQNTREPDAGIAEGVCNIIYAAPRTELRELQVLRDLLMHKYGREFSIAVMENRDQCVSERVVRKLNLVTPSPELVDACLVEIAKAYGVDWGPAKVQGTGNSDHKDDGEDDGVEERISDDNTVSVPSGSQSESLCGGKGTEDRRTPKLPDIPPTEDEGGKTSAAPPQKPAPSEDEFEALIKRFAALKKR